MCIVHGKPCSRLHTLGMCSGEIPTRHSKDEWNIMQSYTTWIYSKASRISIEYQFWVNELLFQLLSNGIARRGNTIAHARGEENSPNEKNFIFCLWCACICTQRLSHCINPAWRVIWRNPTWAQKKQRKKSRKVPDRIVSYNLTHILCIQCEIDIESQHTHKLCDAYWQQWIIVNDARM